MGFLWLANNRCEPVIVRDDHGELLSGLLASCAANLAMAQYMDFIGYRQTQKVISVF